MRRAVLLACFSLLAVVPALAEAKLSGTGWVLSSAGKRAPTIAFAADGKVSGFSGCNRFFGGYEQSGDKLSFSALAGTRMACKNDAMKVEQGFLDMLAKVARSRREGGKLVLLDAAGRKLAVLSKKAR